MKTFLNFSAVVAFFAILGLIGTCDRADEIVYTMDQETYNEIVDTLTSKDGKPSNLQISDYYLTNYGND